MADLATSAVELLDYRKLAPIGGSTLVITRLTLTLAGQGDDTDKITADALGYHSLWSCSNLVADDDSEVIAASVSADGTYILLAGEDDLSPFTPAVATGDYIITVTGISKGL